MFSTKSELREEVRSLMIEVFNLNRDLDRQRADSAISRADEQSIALRVRQELEAGHAREVAALEHDIGLARQSLDAEKEQWEAGREAVQQVAALAVLAEARKEAFQIRKEAADFAAASANRIVNSLPAPTPLLRVETDES